MVVFVSTLHCPLISQVFMSEVDAHISVAAFPEWKIATDSTYSISVAHRLEHGANCVESLWILEQVVSSAARPVGDNWACLKSMVRTFEKHCGSLSQHGRKHMRAMVNICNGNSEDFSL